MKDHIYALIFNLVLSKTQPVCFIWSFYTLVCNKPLWQTRLSHAWLDTTNDRPASRLSAVYERLLPILLLTVLLRMFTAWQSNLHSWIGWQMWYLNVNVKVYWYSIGWTLFNTSQEFIITCYLKSVQVCVSKVENSARSLYKAITVKDLLCVCEYKRTCVLFVLVLLCSV